MLENTRTTFTNAVVRFIAWNMPFHAEHHAYPSVPFHRLPDFHEIVRQHLKTTERGYARFHGRYASTLHSMAPKS
jgi:fatty acid desaturase